MAQEKNNRSHTGRNVAIGAAVLALLLGGGRYGLGLGQSGGDGMLPQEGDSTRPEQSQTQAAEVTAAPEETAAPAADGVLEIVVREDKLIYEGETTDLAGLRDALLRDWAEGTKVKLTDDHAIKAAYDEAAALLDFLGIPIE